ncbi:MAG: D-erythronate dehydrogenase [Pseudomonadota bacterium]
MKVLIIGAGGMIGAKLMERLVADGALGDSTITHLTAVDVVSPKLPANAPFPVVSAAMDISDAAQVAPLIDTEPDMIFHLAAIVSGEAEKDFEKGYAINLDGTRYLLEAVRNRGDAYRPRLVYASSIAVFGAPFPAEIPDTHHLTPLTSYGTQKAIGELLLADYARRGIVDGIGLRLPTIVVRPGKPNAAASGFFSNIIREPLAGVEAILPVADDVRHWMASPRSAIGFLRHAATMELPEGVNGRSYTMPGLAATVGEMIAALERVAGPDVVARIRREPDPFIKGIVSGWPRAFEPDAARALGFEAEADFEAIIRAHIEDELA